ncbi:hypothetical protein ALC62_04582 [Cyphomyrmex costatus]|uniref:Uncharacterized protein n=1 Tax=Cyphomyrmex costatus TaxID=456900 RepID=A0A195CV93_9HYME|nr:hypothetical protein ALC62_04582 [Cyphomyrmex costatus]
MLFPDATFVSNVCNIHKDNGTIRQTVSGLFVGRPAPRIRVPSPFTESFVGGTTFNYYARLGRQEAKKGTTNVATTSGRCNIVSKQSETNGNINIEMHLVPEYIRNLAPVSRYHGNWLTVRSSLSCGRIGPPASLWKFGMTSEERGGDREKEKRNTSWRIEER